MTNCGAPVIEAIKRFEHRHLKFMSVIDNMLTLLKCFNCSVDPDVFVDHVILSCLIEDNIDAALAAAKENKTLFKLEYGNNSYFFFCSDQQELVDQIDNYEESY